MTKLSGSALPRRTLLYFILWVGLAAPVWLGPLLAIVFAAFFVVVAVWDTPYRLWVTGLIAATLAGASWLLWRNFRRRMTERPRPFKATLEELSADIEHLR